MRVQGGVEFAKISPTGGAGSTSVARAELGGGDARFGRTDANLSVLRLVEWEEERIS
jgi:hypothetical protein